MHNQRNVTHRMHAYQWQQHGWSWCGGGGSCPGLELPSPGSGGAGPSLEPPLDLGAVPVAEMMKDSLKSYTPRSETKDPCNNMNQYPQYKPI